MATLRRPFARRRALSSELLAFLLSSPPKLPDPIEGPILELGASLVLGGLVIGDSLLPLRELPVLRGQNSRASTERDTTRSITAAISTQCSLVRPLKNTFRPCHPQPQCI
jgi:hypothetical protein